MRSLKKNLQYLKELRARYLRLFVLSSLSLNCLVASILYFNGTVGIYRIYMTFASLIIACFIFMVKDKIVGYIRHFKWLENLQTERELSECRRSYFLRKHPELTRYVVGSIPTWYLFIGFIFVTLLNLLHAPRGISGIICIFCVGYLFHILYGQYRVISTFHKFKYPSELQRPTYKMNWSKFWTQENIRAGLKVAQKAYRVGDENGYYKNVGKLLVIAASVDAGHAYYSETRPVFTRPASIFSDGYWTDRSWVNTMAQHLEAAGYDPAKNCIKKGTYYKLDDKLVFKLYTENLDTDTGYVRIKTST